MPKYDLRISADCTLEFVGADDGAIKLARLLPAIGRVQVQADGRADPLLEQTVRRLRQVTRAPIQLDFTADAPQGAAPQAGPGAISPELLAPPGPALIWLHRLSVPGLDADTLNSLIEDAKAEGHLTEITDRRNPVGTLRALQQALTGLHKRIASRRWNQAREHAERVLGTYPWAAPLVAEAVAGTPVLDLPSPVAPPSAPAAAAPAPADLAPLTDEAADPLHAELGPHWIANLPTCASWRLYLYEVASGRGRSRGRRGATRAVALLLPSGTTLADAAKDRPDGLTDDTRGAYLADLAAHSVGTLGFEAAEGEARSAHETLIEWVVRLLPIDGPTHLELRVHGRGRSALGPHWATQAAVARGLAHRDAGRAQRLTVGELAPSGKRDPFGSFAKALGQAWQAGDELGALAPTLIDGDLAPLGAVWGGLDGRRGPAVDAWQTLLTQADRGTPGRLAHSLDQRLQARAAEDPRLWRRYVAATADGLDARGGLRRAADALPWLAAAAPSGHSLGARLRLAGALAGLATGAEPPADLDALSAAVLPEDARLVCRTALARAAQAAQLLDLDQAKAHLDAWAARDPLIIGASLHAELQHALADHAAATGDLPAAQAHLAKALAAADAVSDADEAHALRRRLAQTGAIIALDDGAIADDAVRAQVEALTGPLAQADGLAQSTRPRDVEAHHLLMRALITRPEAFAAEREAVLAGRERWRHREDGHPWPLIALYRALLLDDAGEFEAARDHAVLGASIAQAAGQGPAVRLIGACVSAIAARWGVDWPDRDEQLNALTKAMPQAQARVAALLAFAQAPDNADPRALLRDVLPVTLR